jgi:phosphoglycerol transferase MdoB-like AlkP superfamily enzyme
MLLVLFGNPWVVAARGNYAVSTMPTSSIAALLGVDALLVALSLAIAKFPFIVIRPFNKFASWLSRSDFQQFCYALLPFFIILFSFYISVAQSNGFSPARISIVIIVCACALASSLLVLSLLLLGGLLSALWLAIIFCSAYLSIAAGDFLSITNGGGRITPETLGWLSFESVRMFITWRVFAEGALFFSLVFPGFFFAKRFCWQHRKIKYFAAALSSSALITFVQPHVIFLQGSSALLSQYQRLELRVDLTLISYMQDPFFRFVKLITSPQISSVDIVDLATFKEQKAELHIESAQGNVKLDRPFKRIIFLLVESFSSNFSRKKNAQLPDTLTPNLDSFSSASTDIWTIASPTTNGIAAHFCSHPNTKAMLALNYPNCIVKKFRDNEFKTALFQSPPENFDHGVARFKALGFELNRGAEWQRNNHGENLVKQWGAFDRVTYSSLLDFVETNKDSRFFVTGLTIDSHFPTGRTDYGDMTYPAAPSWVNGDPAKSFLRSVFRADYDLSIFVRDLKLKGLLDEDTVLIVTADHSTPPFPELSNRMGMGKTRFERIPFLVVSGRKLPTIPSDRVGSQLDTAPTLAFLAGIKPDEAWLGENLFGGHGVSTILSYNDDELRTISGDRSGLIKTNDNLLLKLATTVVMNDKERRARRVPAN